MTEAASLRYSLDKADYWQSKSEISSLLIYLSPKSIFLTAGCWHCGMLWHRIWGPDYSGGGGKEIPNLADSH